MTRALLPLLILALLMPRAGVAAAQALGTDRAVICRGDAVVVVRVGADGAPVSQAVHPVHDCLAAIAPGGTATVDPIARLVVPAAAVPQTPRMARPASAWERRFPRAPPV